MMGVNHDRIYKNKAEEMGNTNDFKLISLSCLHTYNDNLHFTSSKTAVDTLKHR